MKVKAIEKLAALQDEAAVKEILEHLEKLNAKKFDADDFFKKDQGKRE